MDSKKNVTLKINTMNEKEVKLREAAEYPFAAIVNEKFIKRYGGKTPSEMTTDGETFTAIEVADFAAACCAKFAKQYHSPSKQEGAEELPSDNECTDIAFDFGYGCDPPKGNKQQEDIHDAAVWGLKKMRDYIKQNYTLTKKQP